VSPDRPLGLGGNEVDGRSEAGQRLIVAERVGGELASDVDVSSAVSEAFSRPSPTPGSDRAEVSSTGRHAKGRRPSVVYQTIIWSDRMQNADV